MKKFLIYVLLSAISVVYGAEIKLSAIDNGEGSVNNNSSSSSITMVTPEDVHITVMASNADEEEIKFAVQIYNKGTKDFNFNENCFSAYQGVFEEKNWAPITYYPATRYFSAKEYEYGASVAVTAVGCSAMLMDLMLAAACDDGPAPRPHYSRPSRPARPTRPARPAKPGKRPSSPGYGARPVSPVSPYSMPFSYSKPAITKTASASIHITYDFGGLLSLLAKSTKDLYYLENSLLYTQTVKPGEVVNGIFFIKRENGPDYKISYFTADQGFINFYFTRSDKEQILHPWKDTKSTYNSLLFTMALPVPDRYGFTYLYAGQPVGFYAGFNFQYPVGVKYRLCGEFDGNNYYPRRVPADVLDQSFIPNGTVKNEVIGIYGGLTVKTFPHTWLMAGCGCNIITKFYNGDEKITFTAEPDKENLNLWAKDPNVKVVCAPQVGLNFVFNVLDVGGVFSYAIGEGPQFDLMFGFAF